MNRTHSFLWKILSNFVDQFAEDEIQVVLLCSRISYCFC